MITICEIDATEAVRALSEHRGPKRYLMTVPFVQEYRAPLAPRKPLVPVKGLMLLPGDAQGYSNGGTNIGAAMDLFKQSRPGEFTASDAAEFMSAVGWRSINPPSSAASKLKIMAAHDLVEELPPVGRRRKWRFK